MPQTEGSYMHVEIAAISALPIARSTKAMAGSTGQVWQLSCMTRVKPSLSPFSVS
jgi:hypothetical protein